MNSWGIPEYLYLQISCVWRPYDLHEQQTYIYINKTMTSPKPSETGMYKQHDRLIKNDDYSESSYTKKTNVVHLLVIIIKISIY